MNLKPSVPMVRPAARVKTLMHQTRIRGDEGITIIELVVVIIIVALAIQVAAISIPSIVDRQVLEREVSRIHKGVLKARRAAIESGTDQKLTLEVSSDVTQLVASSETFAVDPSITVAWIAASEAGSHGDVAKIVFFGTGGASGGRFQFVRGRARAVLEIDWLTSAISRSE